MYFIPSKQNNINCKKITINDFLTILDLHQKHPFINLGFNIGLINFLKSYNNTFTAFDKEILLLQIHINEIKETSISNNSIIHPDDYTLTDGLYHIKLTIPSIEQDLSYSEFIIQNNIKDRDNLLLLEVSKHIIELSINNTPFNYNVEIEQQLNIIKKLPAHIIAKCVVFIDGYKKLIKNFYTQNNIDYKYGIGLLVP
jgi:hypothetical protein